MKYKLRSSSKNATESKSTYHSFSRSSSSLSNNGPPEKVPRVEHGVRGRSGGSGTSLRRKPWIPSLLSVETQTDSQFSNLDILENQALENCHNRVPCQNICDLCGCNKKKRRLPKSENIETVEKKGNIKSKKDIDNLTSIFKDIPSIENSASTVDSLSHTLDHDQDQLNLQCLPLEIILHIMQFLDAKSMLCIYGCSKWSFNMLEGSNAFWKMICVKEELANYSCISEEGSMSDNNALNSNRSDCSTTSSRIREAMEELNDNESGLASSLEYGYNRTEGSETEEESEYTARGISGSSLTSYPTGRTSKRRKISVNKKKAAVSTSLSQEIKMGFADKPMHGEFSNTVGNDSRVSWHKVYLRGLQMRKNIVQSNFEGWRIYANTQVPVTRLTPDLDFNADVKQRMMNYPKLSVNDDLKIDWDDHHLVVFHFFRGDGESCTIRVWDISNEPKFLFAVEKGIECITDKVIVSNGYVVIVPSWPLAADALIRTLSINNPLISRKYDTFTERDRMPLFGKFRFSCNKRMTNIDKNWEHTQFKVVKDMALILVKAPTWQCFIFELPNCELKHDLWFKFDCDGYFARDFECQQIRSFKTSAIVLFTHKLQTSKNQIITLEISSAVNCSKINSKTRLRSTYACDNTLDVALFTDPEEIYLLKRNGDVVIFDPNTNTETIKIVNPSAEGRASPHSEYQLFVNRKEQICVMQSAAEVPHGRNIKVYSYNQELQYTINLDKARYGMSRDESICIYTNGAFLAAADSKKFAIFNVKTGKYLGEIRIPAHLERSKGKEEKYCMFEQTGLSLFIFDEDKLITVHDYERSFPAVLDIYKFW